MNLRNRWMLLAVIASLAVVAMACGGDSPSSDRDLDDVIVLTPTPAEVNCLNGTYPDDAPAFGDDSTVAYETIDSGVGVFKREIGEGTAIKVNSNVRVHYTGFFADGCIFDTTRTRVTEASFQMSGLIQGWQIGMADMKEGGKRRIKIPPEVGYGAAGLNISGFVIPGNATLIFEVELVEVVE